VEKFKKIFKNNYNVDVNSSFEDQEIDSLDIIEFALLVEEAYDIIIRDESLDNIKSFNDLYNLIESSKRTFQLGQEIVYRKTDEIYKVSKIKDDGYELTRIINITELETSEFFDRDY
jgi:acyl carrier protein